MENNVDLNAQIERYIQELREFQRRSTTPQTYSDSTNSSNVSNTNDALPLRQRDQIRQQLQTPNAEMNMSTNNSNVTSTTRQQPQTPPLRTSSSTNELGESNTDITTGSTRSFTPDIEQLEGVSPNMPDTSVPTITVAPENEQEDVDIGGQQRLNSPLQTRLTTAANRQPEVDTSLRQTQEPIPTTTVRQPITSPAAPVTEEIIPNEVVSRPTPSNPTRAEVIDVDPPQIEDDSPKGTGTPAEDTLPPQTTSPTLDPTLPQDVPPGQEYTEPSNNTNEYTANEKLNNYLNNFSETGGIKVQLFTAKRTFPVANGEVQVGKFFDKDFALISRKTTNKGGSTEEITLPAPPASRSLTPNSEAPFALYDIIVNAPGYVPSRYYNIPIFQDIVSLQIADLIPTSAYSGDKEYLEYKEQEPRRV